MYTKEFDVESGDFASAGEVSSVIKQQLKKLGIPQPLIRRVAIVSYEAELNMVIHSMGGVMSLNVTPGEIIVKCDDVGPGIEDIGLAMTEGYSTASEHVRTLGFGAGMGLPNINKNADKMDISSSNEGTHIAMHFFIAQ